MKRIISVCVAALVFFSIPLISFAVDSINSPMREPSVSYSQENGKNVYKFYGEYYDQNGYVNHLYQVMEITIVSDYTDIFVYYGTNQAMGNIVSSHPFDYNKKTYDAVTGSIFEELNGTSPYIGDSSWAIVPPGKNYYFSWARGGAASPVYLVYPSEISVIQRTQGDLINQQTEGFINFKNAIDVVYYKSYMSEPQADPLNRYFIAAGQNGAYLFWINIKSNELDAINYSWDIETDDPQISDFLTYNEILKIKEFFTPKIKISSNNNISLVLDAPDDVMQYISTLSSAGIYTGFFEYDILITVYNLNDGQFVRSSLKQDFILNTSIDLSTEIILDNEIFGYASDYDSIKVYGINYINESTTPLNALSCSWGINPEFEIWKNDMLDYLRLIYEYLSDDDLASDVTIDQSTGAMSEAKDALNELKVTDSNGNEINAASEAVGAFSEAAQAMEELAAPVSAVNGLISDFAFSEPIIYLPLIVGLALGLLVTIIGKNKSD